MKDSYFFYKDKLKEEYLQTFDKVELYCLSNNFGEDEKEEILMELMDMLLNAQRDGRGAESITGKNLEHFCKNFCVKPDTRSQIWESLNRIKRIAWILLVYGIFDFVGIYVNNTGSIWSVKSDLMSLFVGIGVSIVISYIVAAIGRIMMFRSKKFSMRIYNIILALSFVVFIGITGIVLSNTGEITVAAWIQIAGCIVYLIAFYIISYLFYQDKIAKRKETKQNKVTLSETVIEKLPQEFVIQYEKKNARRARFGKEPLTREAYSKKFCKSIRFDKFYLKWYWMIFAGAVLNQIRLDGMSLDILIFALVIVAFLLPGIIWTKSTNRITAWKCEKIEEANRCNMNIIDYMEILMKQSDEKTDTLEKEQNKE